MTDVSAANPARLADLVDTSATVAGTRSRLAKRAWIAALLRGCAPDDVTTVVMYLSGALRQRRTGVGWATLQDLPEPAPQSRLTVSEVDAAFEAMSRVGGPGSQEERRRLVLDLFGRATRPEQEFLVRLIGGELRQGALDGVMQDAVAESFAVPAAKVRRASMLLGSTAAAARIAAADGEPGLDRVGLVVGQPIRPMLAQTSSDVATAMAKLGGPAVVDRKLDGIRIQVHRDADRIAIYTRSLDDITDRLPETVEVVAGLPAQRLILDGEALVLDADGRPEPFQVTAARTMSRVDIDALVADAPVTTYFFDLLHLDGSDFLDRPLAERLDALAATVPDAYRVPGVRTTDPDRAEEYFAESVAAGHEGVVVKALDAPYEAGRRGSTWVKVKPRHTLDLVVLAAEWGHGRRQGWLSNLHLGARGPDGGFVMLGKTLKDGYESGWTMVGKTFKGMSDEMLAWQTKRFLELETHREGHVVYVRPEQVVEVAFDGVQRSSRYPGGVALRFARVVRYRDDKASGEADTIETLRSFLGDPPARRDKVRAMSEMTAEDYESIDRASRELHARGWRKAFTLNEMFEAWASLVAEVEQGYDQMVDEYTNDMACRDWLALVWPMLTERVRDARADELEALDARFRAATLDDGGRAIGRFYRVENKNGWWWRRRPCKVAGVFAADLAAE